MIIYREPADGETQSSGGEVSASEMAEGWQKEQAGSESTGSESAQVGAESAQESDGQTVQSDGQTAQAVAAAPATPAWHSSPLPPDHPGVQKGFRTWGDVQKSYEASSQEAHRLAEEARTFNQLREGYQQMVQQYQQQIAKYQQPAAPAAQANPNQFNIEQFQQLAKDDPLKAIQMAAVEAMRRDPSVVKDILKPHLEPYERMHQETQNRLHQERMQNLHGDVANRYPTFKPGTPEHQATEKYAGENPWLVDLAKAYPAVNVIEVAHKLATYDIMAQKLRAQETKLIDKRSKAATVRTGSGGSMVHSNENIARAAAADLAAQGHNIPESWQANMEAAIARKMN